MALQNLDSPARKIRAIPVPQIRAFLTRYGLVIIFLASWQLSGIVGWISPAVFPPLDRIAVALWTDIASGALVDEIAISLQRAGLAFGAAVGLGIPLGLLMGLGDA